MLHKQVKGYLFIERIAKISLFEIRSLLNYDRGQCGESSYLDAVNVQNQPLRVPTALHQTVWMR